MQAIGQNGGIYDIAPRPFRKGSFSRVYRASLAIDTPFLAKGSGVILKHCAKALAGKGSHGGSATSFNAERLILEGISHPNIVRLYDYGEHRGAPFLVEELCPGRMLTYRLKDAAGWELLAFGLLDALGALHEKGIAHGDVDGRNILFGKKAIKLVDYGSCIFFDNGAYPPGWRIDMEPAILVLMRQLMGARGYSETVQNALTDSLRDGFQSSAIELKGTIQRALHKLTRE